MPSRFLSEIPENNMEWLTAELPATLRKHFDDHPVLPPPSYVKGQFKEVLDFLIDCGARYRLYET